jgi:hypothetical protein
MQSDSRKRSTVMAGLVAIASVVVLLALFVLVGPATGSPRGYFADGARKDTKVSVVLAPKGDQSKLSQTSASRLRRRADDALEVFYRLFAYAA